MKRFSKSPERGESLAPLLLFWWLKVFMWEYSFRGSVYKFASYFNKNWQLLVIIHCRTMCHDKLTANFYCHFSLVNLCGPKSIFDISRKCCHHFVSDAKRVCQAERSLKSSLPGMKRKRCVRLATNKCWNVYYHKLLISTAKRTEALCSVFSL